MTAYIPKGTTVRVSTTYYKRQFRGKVGTVANTYNGNVRVMFSDRYYDFIDIKPHNLIVCGAVIRQDAPIEEVI